jgi:hypothetical protein
LVAAGFQCFSNAGLANPTCTDVKSDEKTQIQRNGSHATTRNSAFRHATQFVNLADRALTRPALRPFSRALVEAHFSPLSIVPMSAVAFTAMCVGLDRSACAHLH